MSNRLILASQSPFRSMLLQNAGLSFLAEKAMIDERAVEKELGLKKPKELALALGAAKARDVSQRFADSLIIGCDQVLEFQGTVLHKVKSLEEAKKRLHDFSGQTHYLHSSVVLVQKDGVIWNHVSTAKLHMRHFDDRFIDHYLERVGDGVLQSVGAYQIEAEGIQLFDQIDGDYFTIIGMPLLPLLQQLRFLGVIDD